MESPSSPKRAAMIRRNDQIKKGRPVNQTHESGDGESTPIEQDWGAPVEFTLGSTTDSLCRDIPGFSSIERDLSSHDSPLSDEQIGEVVAHHQDVLAALGEPTVVLYVTKEESGASVRAFRALEAARVAFYVENSTDHVVAARWGGRSFQGVDEVERLASALKEFGDEIVAESGATDNLHVRDLTRERYCRLLTAAKAQLDAIVAQAVR